MTLNCCKMIIIGLSIIAIHGFGSNEVVDIGENHEKLNHKVNVD